MVVVSKYFKDITDGLKPYNVGDKVSFSKQREDYLISIGYAKPIKKPKKSVTEE